MNTHTIALLAGATLLLNSFAAAQDTEGKAAQWLQNITEAKSKAEAEKKDLLLDFTGSDWCVWCKRLDQEVFEKDAFQTAVPKDFVLVKLDFPQDDSLVTPEIKKQNEQLQSEYSVQGFPTVILTDAQGRPYAQTGYQQGGAENYVEHIAELKQKRVERDEQFAKAKTAEGVERAKALAAGLDAVGEGLLGFYAPEIRQIIELDQKDEAGLKSRFEEVLDRQQQQKVLQQLEGTLQEKAQAGDWDAVSTAMDKALEEHKGKKLVEQMATFYKAIAAIEGKQDFDRGIELIEAARKVAPESEMGKRLEQIKANVQKMKEQKKGEEGGKGGDGKDGGK